MQSTTSSSSIVHIQNKCICIDVQRTLMFTSICMRLPIQRTLMFYRTAPHYYYWTLLAVALCCCYSVTILWLSALNLNYNCSKYNNWSNFCVLCTRIKPHKFYFIITRSSSTFIRFRIHFINYIILDVVIINMQIIYNRYRFFSFSLIGFCYLYLCTNTCMNACINTWVF